MNRIKELRKAFKGLDEAMKCPVCGKSRMIKAIGWRGNGTHHAAVEFESVSPETHCTCHICPTHGAYDPEMEQGDCPACLNLAADWCAGAY